MLSDKSLLRNSLSNGVARIQCPPFLQAGMEALKLIMDHQTRAEVAEVAALKLCPGVCHQP
eukprot:7299353-Karenia_brevis.AAC.1